MTDKQLDTYKQELKNAIFALNRKRMIGLNLFDTQECCLSYNIFFLSTFVDYLDSRFLLGNQNEYYHNILNYCSLLEYSELANEIMSTNYKPTFMLDATNNQSIINGGF